MNMWDYHNNPYKLNTYLSFMMGKGVTRREIEESLPKMGDYVKIDYLGQCLKKNLDFDTKKYVLNNLAKLYEARGMHAEAARLMANAADINATFLSKMNDFSKSMELFIKAGKYDEADIAFTKSLACANTENERFALKIKRKELIKTQAKDYLNKDKRRNAAEAYEKLLSVDLTAMEKQEAQKTLLNLYEKLGMIREFYSLKRNIG